MKKRAFSLFVLLVLLFQVSCQSGDYHITVTADICSEEEFEELREVLTERLSVFGYPEEIVFFSFDGDRKIDIRIDGRKLDSTEKSIFLSDKAVRFTDADLCDVIDAGTVAEAELIYDPDIAKSGDCGFCVAVTLKAEAKEIFAERTEKISKRSSENERRMVITQGTVNIATLIIDRKIASGSFEIAGFQSENDARYALERIKCSSVLLPVPVFEKTT